MKLCKNILSTLLQDNKFSFFHTIELVLKKIFTVYRSKIVFLKIEKKVVHIGVLIPQFLSHFTLMKNDILLQFQKELPAQDLIEVNFFYYYKKSYTQKINDHQKSQSNSLSLIEKKRIEGIVKQNCSKNDLHEFLYNLYIKNVIK